jgi:O-antigen ligase
VLARVQVPLWVLLGTPLMVLSLALSYRRSFWIGVVLGLLLVLLLGLSPLGRRLLVPTGLLVAVAIWALASIGFQTQTPIAERAASLKPSKIQSNAQDRYRIDERVNVVAEIRERPLTGLGLAVPWSSKARPLPIDHENGRQYVHTTALWYWLRLGLLGVLAFVLIMVAAARLAYRVWRGHADPLMRAVGLGSLCALIGLAVIETTGTFTGVHVRFTIVFGLLLGVLAVLGRQVDPLRAPAPA